MGPRYNLPDRSPMIVSLSRRFVVMMMDFWAQGRFQNRPSLFQDLVVYPTVESSNTDCDSVMVAIAVVWFILLVGRIRFSRLTNLDRFE